MYTCNTYIHTYIYICRGASGVPAGHSHLAAGVWLPEDPASCYLCCEPNLVTLARESGRRRIPGQGMWRPPSPVGN